MENFIDNVHRARSLVVEKDTRFYSHHVIANTEIRPDTISIVMTAHNRSRQLYFTLDTIQSSSFRHIQIILVDDSDTDPVSTDRLQPYPFYFDLIRIDRDRKFWANPCVNYNLGFQYIKGSRVILQNSEVCHVGDVVGFIHTNLKPKHYMCMEVIASLNHDTNDQIYAMEPLHSFYQFNNMGHLFYGWYQHHVYRPKNFHFLTAFCTGEVKGFSYDLAFGSWYDDDDLIFQIEKVNQLTIDNIRADQTGIGGVHLYHGREWQDTPQTILERQFNRVLLLRKQVYWHKEGIYPELSGMDRRGAIQLAKEFALF